MLQIYSVEDVSSQSATCIVRCVGGIVSPGQRFTVHLESEDSGKCFQVVLDWINRYGHLVEFVDPPHDAKVRLTGDGAPLLREGLTISSVE
jgi:hypothetical protein